MIVASCEGLMINVMYHGCHSCQRKDTSATIRQNDVIECHACWTERYRRVFGISGREASRYSNELSSFTSKSDGGKDGRNFSQEDQHGRQLGDRNMTDNQGAHKKG